jgi:hypothetical protein
VGTLEWQTPTPVPPHNFDAIPSIVRGPHEYQAGAGLSQAEG